MQIQNVLPILVHWNSENSISLHRPLSFKRCIDLKLLKICQSEAAKFSKDLEEQLKNLQTYKLLNGTLRQLDQLLMNLNVELEAKFPKSFLRTLKTSFLQQEISLIDQNLPEECIDQLWKSLKNHPKFNSWLLLETDNRILWKYCSSLNHSEEENWKFLEKIFSLQWRQDPKIIQLNWDRFTLYIWRT